MLVARAQFNEHIKSALADQMKDWDQRRAADYQAAEEEKRAFVRFPCAHSLDLSVAERWCALVARVQNERMERDNALAKAKQRAEFESRRAEKQELMRWNQDTEAVCVCPLVLALGMLRLTDALWLRARAAAARRV